MDQHPGIPQKEVPAKKKRRLWLRITGIVLSVILIVAIVGSSWVYWQFRKELPKTAGTLQLKGLQHEVTVVRDTNGTPHIVAQTTHDLYMAQGFVTAQDRLFQMDLSRRQASGELSEVVGSQAVSTDEYFRTIGLRRAAEASYSGYTKNSKNVMQWYADGVNAYMQQAKAQHKLPVSFRLLGYEPQPWTPIDSLTIGKYMAYDLGGHYQGQVFRSYLLQHFPKAKALDLFPSYPSGAPTILQANRTNPTNVKDLLADAVLPNPFNGSNNWVVSGSKTASGKPYLANDPHLSIASPSIWYETNLNGPHVDVSGVTFAGVPGIIVGHNEQIAWGVTNVGPDVQDLYIEKPNPSNPNQFEYMGKWETAQVIPEDIKVKGENTIHYKVTVTRHGPIISDFANEAKNGTKLALRWTALDPTTELEAVLQMDQATNWDQFKTALEHFQSPAQNFVFASQDGTIAYRANGLIPIRKNGDSLLPVPGWTNAYEWTGYIPWNQLPTVVNPPSGFIATANNKVVSNSYPYHITNTWAQPYREERIQQVLQSKPTFTVSDMKALQFDHFDEQAAEFLPQFLPKLLSQSSKLRNSDQQALKLLSTWNYDDSATKGAPLVFRLWETELPNILFKGQIPDNVLKFFEDQNQTVDQLMRHALAGNPGPWVQDSGGLDKVLLESFQMAVDRATQLEGSNPSTWQWGAFHKVDFAYPLSAKKPLNLIFNPTKPLPVGGSEVTVGAAGWNLQTGEVNHGAPWRSVTDLANLNVSFNEVAPGESGNVLSPYYGNQIKNWTTDGYHTTYLTPSQFDKNGKKLVLKP